jgi:hypothetical protein
VKNFVKKIFGNRMILDQKSIHIKDTAIKYITACLIFFLAFNFWHFISF